MLLSLCGYEALRFGHCGQSEGRPSACTADCPAGEKQACRPHRGRDSRGDHVTRQHVINCQTKMAQEHGGD